MRLSSGQLTWKEVFDLVLTQLRFLNLGFGHAVCANKIFFITKVDTKQSGRIIKEAKQNGKWFDATCRRPLKSILIMDDGTVVGCFLTPGTVFNRLMNILEDNLIEEQIDEEKEDE